MMHLAFTAFALASAVSGMKNDIARKRALIVTVCGKFNKRFYEPTALESTVRDAGKMISFLTSQGYNITWLKDFQHRESRYNMMGQKREHVTIYELEKNGNEKVPNADPRMEPTDANILRELSCMAEQTKSGDECFFYYSGHGVNYRQAANIPDGEISGPMRIAMRLAKLFTDKKTPDCIMPQGTTLGMPTKHIYDNFTSRLPYGSKAILMFDCCMSGSMSGLRYRLDHDTNKWQDKTRREGPSADVLSISACNDHELAEDEVFTNMFLKTVNFMDENGMENDMGSTNMSLTLQDIQERLIARYREASHNFMTPQIEASFNYNLDYTLSDYFSRQKDLQNIAPTMEEYTFAGRRARDDSAGSQGAAGAGARDPYRGCFRLLGESLGGVDEQTTVTRPVPTVGKINTGALQRLLEQSRGFWNQHMYDFAKTHAHECSSKSLGEWTDILMKNHSGRFPKPDDDMRGMVEEKLADLFSKVNAEK